MPGRQHEPVAIGPGRVGRGVAQEARPDRVGHRRGAHRGARDGRSSPAGRRRSRASGWCRWRGGRGRASRRSWAGTPSGSAVAGGSHCRSRSQPRSAGPAPDATPRRGDYHPPDAPTTSPEIASCPRTGHRRGRATSSSTSCWRRHGRWSSGSDVPGRVSLVQGGSAANTARWLGRLGARASLVGAVGRDATGRALARRTSR